MSIVVAALPSPDAIARWCATWFDAPPTQVLFEAGHFFYVVGLRLADKRTVVVKARPPARRLHTCWRLQRDLWAAGFPCPEPLVRPVMLGSLVASAEAYVPDGEPLERRADSPRLFAEALAELVMRASQLGEHGSLQPAPAWLRWGDDEAALWPRPDDRDDDINASPGPRWIEDVARRARDRLRRSRLPRVIGHGDWESQNLRWRGRRLDVAHDWDSLVRLPEATIAGASAAAFPGEGAPEAAAVDETAEFLDAYEAARAEP